MGWENWRKSPKMPRRNRGTDHTVKLLYKKSLRDDAARAALLAHGWTWVTLGNRGIIVARHRHEGAARDATELHGGQATEVAQGPKVP